MRHSHGRVLFTDQTKLFGVQCRVSFNLFPWICSQGLIGKVVAAINTVTSRKWPPFSGVLNFICLNDHYYILIQLCVKLILLGLVEDRSAIVQIMVGLEPHRCVAHCLNQCWPSSFTHTFVSRSNELTDKGISYSNSIMPYLWLPISYSLIKETVLFHGDFLVIFSTRYAIGAIT